MLERLWNAVKPHRWLIVSTLLALSAGMLIGVAVRPESRAQEEPETAPVDRIGFLSILPETQLRITYEFSDCLHTVTKDLETLPHIGQTEKDLLADFPKGTIASFSSEEVVIKEQIEGVCPHHVLLMADADGKLHVFQTDTETMEKECLQTLALHADDFDPETAEELYRGVPFESVAEVNQYLENVES